MNSDFKDKKRLIHSFKYALTGIFEAIRQERNLKIHLSLSLIVVFMGFLFSISTLEWLVLFLAIGGMLSLELVNSSIERVVDLITGEYHPLAKAAKDIAAGAVFIFAIVSVVIGFIIFFPKLSMLF